MLGLSASTLASLLFSAIKALGLVDLIEAAIAEHRATLAGEAKQGAADDAAALQEDQRAKIIDDRVAGLSDAELAAAHDARVRRAAAAAGQ